MSKKDINEIGLRLRFKGELTLILRNAETLEKEWEHTEYNTVTGRFYRRWLAALELSANADGNVDTAIFISNRKLSSVMSLSRIGEAFTNRDIVIQAPTFFTGSPDYMEIINRFNPPVSTRTINSIFIGTTTSATVNNLAVAYAALSTPCSQTNVQVLDVTYRIQAFYEPFTLPSFPISDEFGRAIARGILVPGQGSGTLLYRYPADAQRHWCKVPPSGTYHASIPCYDTGAYIEDASESVFSQLNSHGKIIHTITRTGGTGALSFATTQNIGKIFQSIAYGNVRGGITGTNINIRGNIAWAHIVPTSFTGSGRPIQPIHNHSANAIEPFLDVDFLSSSTGFITMGGSGWTDPDYPEFYRIEYQNTGDLGMARYFFRKRNIIGFEAPNVAQDSTYRTSAEPLPFMVERLGMKTHTNAAHGLIPGATKIEYNARKIVLWDLTGVTIQDIIDHTTRTFDAASSPALICTAIRQVCVDDSGNIWVACATGGLFKITTPLGVATVTHFTNAIHGIPVAGETACYGVCPGYLSSVWAGFNGGLLRTDNGGTSWVTPAFTFTGISDSNWINITYIEADRNSPDHQLVILSETLGVPGTSYRAIWWSTAAAAAINSTISTIDNFIHSFKCSRRGSLWTFKRSTAVALSKINYGATTAILIGPGAITDTDLAKPAFFYDYYNVPYVLTGSPTGTATDPTIYNADTLKGYDRLGGFHSSGKGAFAGVAFSTSGASRESSLTFEEDPRGFMISRPTNSTGSASGVPGETSGASSNSFGYSIVSACPRAITAGTVSPDPLNGQHSPFEEFVWDKYHWNGAAWVLDFYSPATDTSLGAANPGVRHNFNTESHTFTGRSMIDATTVFDASIFGNPALATFAFRIIPTAKFGAALDAISRQEFRRVLLSIEDATQKFRLVWSNSDTASIGSIIVEHNATSSTVLTTPADGTTNRIVVTINGTSCKVYNNGAQIGTTITLPATFNFTNTGGTLKCHVGATVFPTYQKYSIAPTWFYRGEMTNVQFWNVEWSAANVTEDFGLGGTGVIAGQPAANQIARYELTQSLSGLETKVTHASIDPLFHGLTIKFDPGAGTDFIIGDYLTFGVVDGILKDNATSFSQQFSLYLRPVDLNFTEFKNGAAGTTITASTTTVTERAVWSLDRQTTLGTTSMTGLNSRPGEIAANIVASGDTIFTIDRGGITSQSIPGNGYIQFKVNSSKEVMIVGLTTTPTGMNIGTQLNFGIHFEENGTVNIRELNVTPGGGTAVATYVAGDEFRVERVGTTITYTKITGGPTLLYTSLVSSAGTLYGRFVSSAGNTTGGGSSIWGAVMNYARPAYYMTVGNLGTITGSFDPEFLRVETADTATISISLNATPISASNILVSDTWQGNMLVPAAGQVVINGETGWLIFNAADNGATVTGSVNVVFNEV